MNIHIADLQLKKILLFQVEGKNHPLAETRFETYESKGEKLRYEFMSSGKNQ